MGESGVGRAVERDVAAVQRDFPAAIEMGPKIGIVSHLEKRWKIMRNCCVYLQDFLPASFGCFFF